MYLIGVGLLFATLSLGLTTKVPPAEPLSLHDFQDPPLQRLTVEGPWNDTDLALIRAAQQALQRGKAEHAVQRTRYISKESPYSPEARRLRAWAYLMGGKAPQVLEELSDDELLSGELLYLRGAAKHASNRRSDAQRDLQKLWWQEPNTLWGLFALRLIAEEPGAYTSSEARSIRQIVPPPSSVSSQNTHTAVALLNDLREQHPKSSRLRRELLRAEGLRLLSAEEFTQAEQLLLQSLVNARDLPFIRAVRLALGEASHRRGQLTSSLKHFDFVIGSGHDHLSERALALAGQTLIEHRRYQEARERFQIQMLRNPLGSDRISALWGLGWVAFRSGDFRSAQRFFCNSPAGDTLWTKSPLRGLLARSYPRGARTFRRCPPSFHGRCPEVSHRLLRLPSHPLAQGASVGQEGSLSISFAFPCGKSPPISTDQ